MAWGGQPDTLSEWSLAEKKDSLVQLYQNIERQEGYAGFIIENAYAEELLAFFSQVEHGTPASYSFEEDLETLRWIDLIEQMGDERAC